MNFDNLLITAKGENVTFNIIRFMFSGDKCEITFKNGKKYNYNSYNVRIIQSKSSFDPKMYLIKHNGRELFDISSIREFSYTGGRIWRIQYGNGKITDYDYSSLEINKSVLDNNTAADCLHYLSRMADLNDLTDDDGNKILSEQYRKIAFVKNNTVLAHYLNPENKDNCFEKPISSLEKPVTPIFPFGCNLSQYKAVKNALENNVSVIEGPPGTGKTQTILNLIANIVLNGETVQIVSNNNAATDNVLEKMAQEKYGFDFIAARLGSKANKEAFIANQTGKYPSLSSWKYSGDDNLIDRVKNLSAELSDLYAKQQELAQNKSKLISLNTEFNHFLNYCRENEINTDEIIIDKTSSSNKIIKFLQKAEHIEKISFITKLRGLVICKVGKISIYKQGTQYLADTLRYAFYVTRKAEIEKQIEELTAFLEKADASAKEKELQNLSLAYFKDYLSKKYSGNILREIFTDEEIFKDPDGFLKEYPVILSTTFSSINSVRKTFDYVIVDESSQADISTGVLALCSAEKAVIVGDSCQLPFVLSDEKKSIARDIFNKYHLPEAYDFSTNSFLDSVKKVFTSAPVTVLREHYRCNPKIIEFCNQKFYNGQLVIMTDEQNDSPLAAVKTVSGDHAREKFNQRQIDVIVKEILPSLDYSSDEIGIIAPYNEQINRLIEAVDNEEIKISTVHKFQGREKKVIIFSTVDNQIREFVDDPKLLNVAISRAEEKFIIVIGNDSIGDGNIADLVSYIEYNNFEVSESNIYSVFDMLYSANTEARLRFLSKHRKISEYDSENLMFAEINEVIKDTPDLKVECHVPLRMLIKDKSLLNADEQKYVSNNNTHVDFLIYNRVSKKPVLIIEVDGYHFHKKGTKQAERDILKNEILNKYNLSFLRLNTTESGEEEIIKKALSINKA